MLYIPYNIGLIKQQKELLILKRLQEQKDILATFQSKGGSLETLDHAIKEIHIVKNNLRLTALNEWHFLEKIEDVLILTKSQKAPPEAIKVVVDALNDFINYFDTKVDKLLKQGENDLYLIELFHNYSALCELLKQKAKVRDLFFPIPEYTKEFLQGFKTFDPMQLRVKTEVPFTDFDKASSEYLGYLSNQNPSDVPDAKKALEKMIKVVRFYKSLHTKPHFFGYLTALLARLQLARLREFADLNAKTRMYEIINHARTEMQSFRGVERNASQEAINSTMYDFIFEDKIKDFEQDAFISEALKVFNIHKFVQKAKLNVDSREKDRKRFLKIKRNDIQKVLRTLISNLELIRENLNNKEEVSNALIHSTKSFSSGLNKAFAKFLSANVAENVMQALGKLEQANLSSHTVIKEYIAIFYVLDVYLEQLENVSDQFILILKEQCERAKQSVEGIVFEETIDWATIGKTTLAENYSNLYTNVLGLQKHISESLLSLVLEKNTRETKEVKERLSEDLLRDLSNLLAIFTIDKKAPAITLISALRNDILNKKIEGAYVYSEEEKERSLKITQSIALYIEGLQRNDSEPEQMLEKILIDLDLTKDRKNVVEELHAEYSPDDVEETQAPVKRSMMSIGLTDTQLKDNDIELLQPQPITKEEMLQEVKDKVETQELESEVLVVNQIEESELQNANINFTETEKEQVEEGVEEATTESGLTDSQLEHCEIISRDDLDDEIMEILMNQFEEFKADLVPQSIAGLNNHTLSVEQYKRAKADLKRFSHTMKGDLRTVGLSKLGKLYEISEFLLKDKLDNHKFLTHEFMTEYENLLMFNNDLVEELNDKFNEKDGKDIIIFINPEEVNAYQEIFKLIPHEVEQESDIEETQEHENDLALQSLLENGFETTEEIKEEVPVVHSSFDEAEPQKEDEVVETGGVEEVEEVQYKPDSEIEESVETQADIDIAKFVVENDDSEESELETEFVEEIETSSVHEELASADALAVEKIEVVEGNDNVETIEVNEVPEIHEELTSNVETSTVEQAPEKVEEIETTEQVELIEENVVNEIPEIPMADVQNTIHKSMKVLSNIEESEENLEAVLSVLNSLEVISKEFMNIKQQFETMLFNKKS